MMSQKNEKEKFFVALCCLLIWMAQSKKFIKKFYDIIKCLKMKNSVQI